MRKASIANRLALLAHEAGSALVSDEALARLSAAATLAEGTKAEITLECHLGHAGGRVDLVLGLTPSDRDLLRNSRRLSPRVRRFLQRWADKKDVLSAIPYLELEIDLDPAREAPPSTWIGPTIEPRRHGSLADLVRDRGELSPREWPSYRLAMEVAAEGGLTSGPWRKRLDVAFRALPRSGSIHHFAAFDTRGHGAGVRLIVSLPRYDVERYLRGVGFLGRIAAVTELLDAVVPFEGQVDLDINLGLVDAGERTATYIEMIAPRRVSSRYQATMDVLERWCGVPKAQLDALDAWVGRVDGSTARELSIKIGFAKEHFAKAYLQARRDPYKLIRHRWGASPDRTE